MEYFRRRLIRSGKRRSEVMMNDRRLPGLCTERDEKNE
jgi:hypothetical protein